jgi:GrpB-like predicted nucleotidyltransferase (UPF0157 family)
MLTTDEKDFLSKIPADKKVNIYPFDPNVAKIAGEIIKSIHNIYSGLEVKHMGASALGISGQNDADIYAFADSSEFDKFLPGLIKLFGKPLHQHETFREWKFKREGIDIEFYLTAKDSETMQKQIKVFEILKNNKDLLKEYENLKSSMNGKSYRQYQEKKYEFYHLIQSSSNIFGAIEFLINSIKTTGHNPKPVIFHSLKVALLIQSLGYKEDIIISALLHDLIEDSETSYEDIKKKFGKKVADVVQALTFDSATENRIVRDKNEIDKAIKFGGDAVIVKTSDFIDNSYFYQLAEKELQPRLIDKYRYFLTLSKPIIGNEEIYKKLENRFGEINHD